MRLSASKLSGSTRRSILMSVLPAQILGNQRSASASGALAFTRQRWTTFHRCGNAIAKIFSSCLRREGLCLEFQRQASPTRRSYSIIKIRTWLITYHPSLKASIKRDWNCNFSSHSTRTPPSEPLEERRAFFSGWYCGFETETAWLGAPRCF
jgi:hypothetical protein